MTPYCKCEACEKYRKERAAEQLAHYDLRVQLERLERWRVTQSVSRLRAFRLALSKLLDTFNVEE